MIEDGITLEELSQRTGMEPRTLRSWVSEGLLAPPFKGGRGARYPEGNVFRALAARTLKEIQGLQLADVRKKLMLASDEEIRSLASDTQSTDKSLSSAREYLRCIRAAQSDPDAFDIRKARAWDQASPDKFDPLNKGTRRPRDGKPEPFGKSSASIAEPTGVRRGRMSHTVLGGIEALLSLLEVSVTTSPQRRARANSWSRIPITPDLELTVRGDLSPRERAMLERIADLIRAILTGGLADDT